MYPPPPHAQPPTVHTQQMVHLLPLATLHRHQVITRSQSAFGFRLRRPVHRISRPSQWLCVVIIVPILQMRKRRPKAGTCLTRHTAQAPQGHSGSRCSGLLSLDTGTGWSSPGVRGPSEDRAWASVPSAARSRAASAVGGPLCLSPPLPLSRFPGRKAGTRPPWRCGVQQCGSEPPQRHRASRGLQLLPRAPRSLASEARAPFPPAPPQHERV